MDIRQTHQAQHCSASAELHSSNSTDLRFSALLNSKTDVATKWANALRQGVYWPSPFPIFRLFSEGFDLPDEVDELFEDRSQHFNLAPKALTHANVQALIDCWQPAISELTSRARQEFRMGCFDEVELRAKLTVLDGLQTVVDKGFKPLAAAFQKHHEVKTIDLDASPNGCFYAW